MCQFFKAHNTGVYKPKNLHEKLQPRKRVVQVLSFYEVVKLFAVAIDEWLAPSTRSKLIFNNFSLPHRNMNPRNEILSAISRITAIGNNFMQLQLAFVGQRVKSHRAPPLILMAD